jgi:hypothetical protein
MTLLLRLFPKVTVIAALTVIPVAAVAPLEGPPNGRHKPAAEPTVSPGRQQIRQAYARLPLSFVPNTGQLDSRVRYSARQRR